MKPWKRLSTEIRMKNPWWEYRFDRFELPDGRPGDYHYVHTYGSVFVIGIDAQGKTLWNHQYRYLFDRVSVELPGGGVKEHQSVEEAARAELNEEAGFDGKLEFIGKMLAFDGIADEYQYVYVATNLVPITVERDATEEFELVRLAPDEVEAMIRRGEILSGMSIAAWYLAKPRVLQIVDELKQSA